MPMDFLRKIERAEFPLLVEDSHDINNVAVLKAAGMVEAELEEVPSGDPAAHRDVSHLWDGPRWSAWTAVPLLRTIELLQEVEQAVYLRRLVEDGVRSELQGSAADFFCCIAGEDHDALGRLVLGSPVASSAHPAPPATE